MSILNPFKKKKAVQKKAATQPEVEKVLFERRFIQSHSFKGYRRIRMSYFGYKPAEKGLSGFRKAGYPLEGSEIIIRIVQRGEYRVMDLYVAGFLISSMILDGREKSNLLLACLIQGNADKAHIRIEFENVVGYNKSGEFKSVKRERIFLFLHPQNVISI